jgi:transcription factor S
MFCKKCGCLLMPKDGKMACGECGVKSTASGKIEDKKKPKKKLEIMDSKNIDAHFPEIKHDCGKCEHGVCYFWTKQTRSSDEPETKFYKCTKCGHTFREYD